MSRRPRKNVSLDLATNKRLNKIKRLLNGLPKMEIIKQAVKHFDQEHVLRDGHGHAKININDSEAVQRA